MTLRLLALTLMVGCTHGVIKNYDDTRNYDPIQLDHESADTKHTNDECSGGWAYPFVVPVPGSGGAIKTWATGESLGSADLNGNFQHIHNNMVGGHGARLVDADVSAAANVASSKLAAYRYIPVAWFALTFGANCVAGTCSLGASANITSVVWLNAGDYRVTLGTTRTNVSYAPLVTSQGIGVFCFALASGALTTTTFDVKCINTVTGADADGAFGAVVYDND